MYFAIYFPYFALLIRELEGQKEGSDMRHKMINRCYLLFLFLLMVAVITGGCGSSGGGGGTDTALPPDEYEAEPFATTRILSDGAMTSLSKIDADGTLHFTGVPAELQGLAEEMVLLGGVNANSPTGFIRMVTSIETPAEGLVVHTVPVPIQLAFRKLHVKFTRTIPDIAGATFSPKAFSSLKKSTKAKKAVLTEKVLDFFAFNGDDDPATEDDQVHITGNLSGGVDYTFGLNVDWGDVFDIPDKVVDCAKSLFTSCSVEDMIPEAKVGFSALAGVHAGLDMKGVSFLPYTKDIPLASNTGDPIKIGPLWFFPELDVSARIEGAASSKFSVSTSLDGSAGAEIAYSNKTGASLVPPHVDGFDIGTPKVDSVLDAYSKVRLGPRLALKLYNIAGPYAGIYGFAELKADPFENPCWTLNGGLEGELGFLISVKIPLFGTVTLADWNESLDIWDTKADSGSCTGSSTGALTPFQEPKFTPWAKAYGNTVVTTGLPYTAPGGGIAGTDLQPTIDGRFVVAGSGSKGLLKIDNEGKPIWAKRFLCPLLNDPFIDELMPDHVTYTQDAAMFVSAYPWALLKVDASGDLEWARQFPFKPNDDWWRISDIEADGSGGLYLTASYGTAVADPLDVDTLVARLDANGQFLWLNRIGNSGKAEVPRIIIPFDGGIVLAGTKCDLKNTLCGNWRLWAINLKNDGTILWKKEYLIKEGGTYDTSVQPLSGHEAVDKDLIIAGTIDASPQRSFFAKIKPDGTLSFLTAYKSVYVLNLADLALTSLAPLPDSGYIATGVYHPYIPYPNEVDRDLWIAKLDGIGQVQWINRLKGPDKSAELLPAIQYTDDGGALVTGYTEEQAGGGKGFWSVKVFAKDVSMGTSSFTSSSGVTVEKGNSGGSFNVTNDTATFCSPTCLGLGTDWTPAVQGMSVNLDPIDVTVEDLPVTATPLAP